MPVHRLMRPVVLQVEQRRSPPEETAAEQEPVQRLRVQAAKEPQALPGTLREE